MTEYHKETQKSRVGIRMKKMRKVSSKVYVHTVVRYTLLKSHAVPTLPQKGLKGPKGIKIEQPKC